MPATTTEGTGPGSAAEVNKPILNGVVKDYNISHNALDSYHGVLYINGENQAEPVAYIDGQLEVENAVQFNSTLYVDGKIESDSYIRGYALGQLLNTSFYTFNDGVLTNNSGTYTDFATVSYTPVYASSTLLIEYHATYSVNGNGTDDFRSRITVGASELTWRTQQWGGSAGTGTRGAVLFPISMVYTNSNLTAKTIKVSAAQGTANDTLSVDTTSAYLRISEYAR